LSLIFFLEPTLFHRKNTIFGENMSKKELNIVCFDNPFPPNYGGVIDVYYKLKALHKIGVKIHLHCFVKKIVNSEPDLKNYCESITYYKRSSLLKSFFSTIPFSVKNRDARNLMENLSKNNFPILFEGFQTTNVLINHDFENKIFLRMLNNEANYYKGLSISESVWHKKLLYFLESKKYFRYQNNIVSKFDTIFAVAPNELNLSCNNSIYVPLFHGNSELSCVEGIGNYAFFHGDLRISDNIKVVEVLIDCYSKWPQFNLRIGSNFNNVKIQKMIAQFDNISFHLTQNFIEIQSLMQNSQFAIMWSFQMTGSKLKLINSLANSRYVIINEYISSDEKVNNLCLKANSTEELFGILTKYSNVNFSFEEILKREELFNVYYSDVKNAEIIKNTIFR
jgi:hypothetical protein